MDNLDIPFTKRITVICTNEFWCNWCCDCGLRHLYHFTIIRGKNPEDDRVEMCIDRDDWATLAARKIKRLQKKLKALKDKYGLIE